MKNQHTESRQVPQAHSGEVGELLAGPSTSARGVSRERLLEALSESKANGTVVAVSLAGAHLVGMDLAKCNFSGQDLTGADLSRANLCDANFLGAKLDGAKFCDSDCERAEFGGARLNKTVLTGCNLKGASLGHAEIAASDFSKAILDESTLVQANVEDTNLQIASLEGARLQDAEFLRCSFVGANLKSAQLDGTSVIECNFQRANMRECSLQNIRDFRSATWIATDTRDVDFTGAYLLRRFMSDQNYLHEFRHQSKWHAATYWVWWVTSDCGRSISRWGLLTAVLVMAFAGIYLSVDIDYGDFVGPLSPVYFSVVTMTTLGYGDVLPASTAAQVVVMLQVTLGYLMLGGLVSILSTKLARRAE